MCYHILDCVYIYRSLYPIQYSERYMQEKKMRRM